MHFQYFLSIYFMHFYFLFCAYFCFMQNNSLVRIGEWSLWRIFLNKGSGNAEISKYHEMNSDADSSSSSSSPNYDPNIFTEVSSSTRII